MKVIALIENKRDGDLLSEHGLAIYIEYKRKKYLLDTGASNRFITNAVKLDVNLSEVDAGILSHGHMDHSGGYEEFFRLNHKASVYMRSQAKEPHYLGKILFWGKYIGIPKNILKQHMERIKCVEGDYQLDPGVWLIPHKTLGLESRGKIGHMYRKVNGKLKYDDFAHEQSLVFEVADGIVIFNSCSHGGIHNVLEEVQRTFPDKKLVAMIGGFHLMGITGTHSIAEKPEDIRDLAEKIKETSIRNVYTGHCTGQVAYKILKETLKERIHYFSTGTTLEFQE